LKWYGALTFAGLCFCWGGAAWSASSDGGIPVSWGLWNEPAPLASAAPKVEPENELESLDSATFQAKAAKKEALEALRKFEESRRLAQKTEARRLALAEEARDPVEWQKLKEQAARERALMLEQQKTAELEKLNGQTAREREQAESEKLRGQAAREREQAELEKLRGQAARERERAELEKLRGQADREREQAELEKLRGQAALEREQAEFEKLRGRADREREQAEVEKLRDQAAREREQAASEKAPNEAADRPTPALEPQRLAGPDSSTPGHQSAIATGSSAGSVEKIAIAEPPSSSAPRSAHGLGGEDYVLGPGDILEVSVWKDESLSRSVVVSPDGTFTFPLLGELLAAGRTLPELKADLENRVSLYVPDPVITLELKQANSMQIYVIGRVNGPGRFLISSRVNVLQALAMAGGLNPFADEDEIKILRENDAGQSLSFDFNYKKVLRGENLEQNIRLQRGDVIVVR